MATKAQENENKILASLINCANDLCGLDLTIEDYPDRPTSSRSAIQHGCDAVLGSSQIAQKIAVQISEVPISDMAYAENARLGQLKNHLLPRMSAAFPGRQVEVIVHSETLQRRFDPERLSNSIFDELKNLSDATGLVRNRLRTVTLDCGVMIDVLKKPSDYPYVGIVCGLPIGQGFDHSFRRVLEGKCQQFSLYAHDHLSCVVLWSSDFCNVGERSVVEAFKLAAVDTSRVNSIWFVHATRQPTVYPLYSNRNDCREDVSLIQPYYWWLEKNRPFETIPHPFGHMPAGR